MNKINNINIGAKGYYKLTVLDKSGNVKKDKSTDYIDNVVSYSGAYESLIVRGIFQSYQCAIGTGTVERTRSSTSLGNLSTGYSNTVGASRTGNEVDNLDGTSTVTLSRTFTFGLGAKVGTFSEVGVYDGSVFIAGQLIKDEFGAPTTITLLSDEQLIVTYVLEWTVPILPVLAGTGSVTDANSNVYNYEVWAQSYFNIPEIGNSSSSKNYSTGVGVYIPRAANGTTDYNYDIYLKGFSFSAGHDGIGNVTYNCGGATLSPSEGVFTDCGYIGASVGNNRFPYGSEFDITEVGGLVYNGTTANSYPIVVKFLNTFTKTSNDSFQLSISTTLSV